MYHNDQFNHYLNQLRNLLVNLLKKNQEINFKDLIGEKTPVTLQIFITILPPAEEEYDIEEFLAERLGIDEGDTPTAVQTPLEFEITNDDLSFLKQIQVKF